MISIYDITTENEERTLRRASTGERHRFGIRALQDAETSSYRASACSTIPATPSLHSTKPLHGPGQCILNSSTRVAGVDIDRLGQLVGLLEFPGKPGRRKKLAWEPGYAKVCHFYLIIAYLA
ncbi:unnamed protein product [Protopolystoma xenopodis]|uniref:Uncharacterized protein n=1 Tax=Protopolystoma xenopodis TaxID=117903 RepID=A0A3S5CR14_9PLAT|nr:unnamed protein product [Protopolystoma xenopodis]